VPFAREYGGLLDNRSFGGAQVSRTFYARGQTGQQLLLGAYQALARQIHEGTVQMFPRTEMLDLVVHEGRAVGIIVRDLVTGEVSAHSAHAVVLATGGYGNVFYLSTNAKGCNVTAIWRAHRKGALMANPCFTQIHPTCIPASDDFQSKLTLMSESLRNDGRVWVPLREDDTRPAHQIPENERDYFLERRYPAFGNLVPRDVASRAAKREVDEGRGVGPLKNGVYLDFGDAIRRLGRDVIEERYGNLFEMYERITDEDPYITPMRIYPAVHYTMGGLWVDYNLMSNIPGLFVLGEANFSDHGANRLGASALMQGLADGYFVAPYTVADYLAGLLGQKALPVDHPAFQQATCEVDDRVKRLLSIKGAQSPDSFHRKLGGIMWENCGMARDAEGLEKAINSIVSLRDEFYRDVRVLGDGESFNQSLEKAGRVADFLEFGELVCRDALHRKESCGGHFRTEYQTEDGEALRDDDNFAYVGAWEFTGAGNEPVLHKEPLEFEYVHLTQRSYK
jgi:succinate dehydrogenase / fumarate reductase, flavoprotein subunit